MGDGWMRWDSVLELGGEGESFVMQSIYMKGERRSLYDMVRGMYGWKSGSLASG